MNCRDVINLEKKDVYYLNCAKAPGFKPFEMLTHISRSLKSVLVLPPQILLGPFGPPKKRVNFNKFNQRHKCVIFLSPFCLLNIFCPSSFLSSQHFGPLSPLSCQVFWSPSSLVLPKCLWSSNRRLRGC